MMGFLNQRIRFYKIMAAYPKAAKAYFFMLASKVYGFSIDVKRDKLSIDNFKNEGKKKGKNIGHAKFDKLITLKFLNVNIGSALIKEGEELSAEHFYLNRSLKDVKLLIKTFNKYLHFNKNTMILDPGCGTGRHLFYLIDKYNCGGIGIDAYNSAIEIANKANIDDRIVFFNKSSLDSIVMKNNMPKNCDYIFINSWLGHVLHHKNFEEMIDYLLSISQYILVIEPHWNKIDKYFPKDVIVETVRIDNAQYSLIKGMKSE